MQPSTPSLFTNKELNFIDKSKLWLKINSRVEIMNFGLPFLS